jgi:hypothetical protein
MTQITVFRRVAGLIAALYRALDARPDPPAFDTYGTFSRAPQSFTQKLFLS